MRNLFKCFLSQIKRSHSILLEVLLLFSKLVLKLDMIVTKEYINNPKEFHSVIKLLLHLADQLPNYKMSQGERLKAEKERQVMENLKAKEAQKEKNEVFIL